MAAQPISTIDEALDFIRRHGIVLESAAGAAPSLACAIVGEAVKGNWWSHPKGKAIFALTRAVRDADEVLVCRLVGGKITLVHRDLWPALVCASARFDTARLARLAEQHTADGRHVVIEQRWPDWVPPEIHAQAASLSLADANARLGVED